MEIIAVQKAHQRCRCKKHELRLMMFETRLLVELIIALKHVLQMDLKRVFSSDTLGREVNFVHSWLTSSSGFI